MQGRTLAFVFLFSLFSSALCFSDSAENAAGKTLSLKEIDILIDSEKYNEALREVSRYMESYPNDFDRAQKRISRIMKAREKYNEGAAALVDVIKKAGEAKSEKLTKIRDLETSEQNSTEYVNDFLNLARRSVTLGDVLVLYNKIMREGVELVRNESWYEAALKFEEGFAIKNEFSDVVFDPQKGEDSDSGKIVVYESDITLPSHRAVESVRNYVAGSKSSSGMKARLSDCEKAYTEYMKALSSRNLSGAESAFKKVEASFVRYAELRNQIMAEVKVLEKANQLAISRNPLLKNSSFVYFQEKFIIGDESNPDTGVIGAMDAYYNTRIEAMKGRTGQLVLESLDSVITNLPENLIYDRSSSIEGEKKKLSRTRDYASLGISVHSLYAHEKDIDGKTFVEKHGEYKTSMEFMKDYITGLSLCYDEVLTLSGLNVSDDKVFLDDFSEKTLSLAYERLLFYETIKSNVKNYIPKLEEEKKKEIAFFEEKERKKRELEELKKISGGALALPFSTTRDTAGVQVADEPLNMTGHIDYFMALANNNATLALSQSQKIWAYLATGYASLAESSYERHASLCSDSESLLNGESFPVSEDESSDELSFIKKYPREAKEKSAALVEELSKKKAELNSQAKILAGGEVFRMTDNAYNSGMLRFEQIGKMYDELSVKASRIVAEADKQMRLYDTLIRQGNEQYELAEKAFREGRYDAANTAVDAASEKFAAALDVEYNEKIRLMREKTLNELAIKIQQAEYVKVLREVYELKDKAATAYYSSDFDGAENILVSAQAKWAGVSTEADPEIDDLLAIVTTVKNIGYGRILEPSDPHYPELSYSLDMARQNFERGRKLKKQNDEAGSGQAFSTALSYIRNVQNVYPLNKAAQLLNLQIQRELDPDGFPRLFEQQYKAAKVKKDLKERLADYEDLYEINPDYPGLAQEIYGIKDSLGMFPKKEIKKEVKKSADSKIAQARKAFTEAGSDEDKLNAALRLANEAIAIDGTSKAAKELKLEIQLKIGSTATAILSQNDEKMYAEAARLFNQRRFADAKILMDRLLTGRAAQKSRKVMDLYNRILKRV